MNVLILLVISDVLSKELWRAVVRSQELIDQLPSECSFNPYLISRGPSGDFEINKEDNYDDGVSDPSLISTSESCLHYIFQLMGYIHECEMCIDEFYFGVENRWSLRNIEPGILFEYFLLLVQRYFELIAEEEDYVPSLYNLSDNDYDQFEEKKKIAQVLLRLLNFASTDFRTKPHISAKLHALIDSVMRQFPDAMCLVVLANFRISGFESLYLVDDIYEGMCPSEYSFRNEQMFQKLDAFKHFQVLSYFTTDRLCSTITCLLKNYGVPHYSETECKKAIVNVCAFLMKTLPNEAAFEAINQLFTELEKPAEIVAFLLEAILAIESEHLRGIIESPEFPIHPVESLKRIADFFSDVLTRKYDFWRIELKKLCPGKKLVAPLTAISEKSFVAGLIFEQIFYKSLFDSKRKLEDVFDENVYERMQIVIDHSKILDGIKHQPEGLQLKTDLSRLLRTRQAKNDDFRSIGITGDMRIGHALNVELKGVEQKRHDTQQIEWKRICRENNPPDYDDRRYQQAVQMNVLTQAAIRELKLSRKEFVREIFAEIDLEIEKIRAQLKPIDDQCLSISKENSALKSSMKHLICERLGLPRQE
jgi:hypothetical protein